MIARAFVGLLLCAVPTPLHQASHDLSDLVKSSVDAVVQIVVSDVAGKPVAEGSGFIVSTDGKIVTNHHVVGGASSAIVKLNSGAFFPVEGMLADDPENDIAVLKVNGKDLPHLNLADSDAVAVGQHVLAIGSPLGLENSVSDGIVSGIRNEADGKSWIQTTAPVSHGNSGGPLLTMDGKAVGVVTRKAKGGENLNFAVPSKKIIPFLMNSAVRPLGSIPTSNLPVQRFDRRETLDFYGLGARLQAANRRRLHLRRMGHYRASLTVHRRAWQDRTQEDG